MESSASWADFAKEVHGWINNFVAPHQLVSISATHDKHPKATKKMVTIVHKAGAVEREVSKANESEENFKMFVHNGPKTELWDEVYKNVLVKAVTDGNDKLVVASANDASNDDKVVIVFSYNKIAADNLEERMRPTGCCTIF